ncbi:hypothetical protein P8C59_001451 [Phyllachora maydis]|uniref:Uncharacterized protein n=1 Tax=Phyllachora maydis TaxID=1825666 RepID=A0AAD9HYH1_9PEZI|nr:hypothetical protein P8C59_001451 [Phyllachora maydis]
MPANDFFMPADDFFMPADDVFMPADDVFMPADDVFMPADDVFMPADEFLMPSNDVTMPATGTSMMDNTWALDQQPVDQPTGQTLVGTTANPIFVSGGDMPVDGTVDYAAAAATTDAATPAGAMAMAMANTYPVSHGDMAVGTTAGLPPAVTTAAIDLLADGRPASAWRRALSGPGGIGADPYFIYAGPYFAWVWRPHQSPQAPHDDKPGRPNLWDSAEWALLLERPVGKCPIIRYEVLRAMSLADRMAMLRYQIQEWRAHMALDPGLVPPWAG